MKFIKKIVKLAGIDEAIAYSVLARVIQAGGGAISIVFISRYLSKVEQGYYYTFSSILAIQIFFELGLSNIITQYVAHEVSVLQWEGSTKLIGDVKAKSRLSSLLKFCFKWFGITAIFLLVALIICGYLFFIKYGKQDDNVDWQIPWVILAIVTAANLLLSPTLAFLEGLGKVKEVSKIRLFQQIIQLTAMFSFLVLGFKLFASPLAATIGFIIVPLWLFYSSQKELLSNIWHDLNIWKINYRLEIFPYQWRIALSWISGYFMYQCFNPIIFATEGAKVAGQMGMTLAVLTGVLSVALTWINTKVPLFSDLIAKKKYIILDQVFKQTSIQASVISALCLLIIVIVIYFLNYFNIELADRFLPISLIILLCIVTFINQLVSALATYLRCHKQEPFLIYSIIIGFLTALSTLLLGRYYGIYGIIIGYTFLTVMVSLPWAYRIFITKKRCWHHE